MASSQYETISSSFLEKNPGFPGVVLVLHYGENFLVLQKGCEFDEEDVLNLTISMRDPLHQKVLSFNQKYYVLTTISKNNLHGVNINTNEGGGIVIGKTKKAFVVAIYNGTNLSDYVHSVQIFEKFLHQLSSL